MTYLKDPHDNNAARIRGGRLWIEGTFQSEQKNVSLYQGYTFMVGTYFVPITTTDTDHLVLWLRNDSSSKLLLIGNCIATWSATGVFKGRMYVGTAEPTANHTAIPAVSSNMTKQTVAPGTFYEWNKTTGTGMTTSSAGQAGAGFHVGQGTTLLDMSGNMIMGYQQTLGFYVSAASAGELSIMITIWYVDIPEIVG